jgi:Domain of unknown function (DUF4111)
MGIEEYLDELVARIDTQLGTRLVGVWLFGSAALGDFDERRSDLDVQAVCSACVPLPERVQLAAALSRDALECPVRGLEFVLYSRDGLSDRGGPAFQLNLNAGPRMARHAGYSAAEEPRFWFILDVAIGRERARTLAGPAAREVFPRLPRSLILRALQEALTWQGRHDPTGVGAVLAACRAWAWAANGRWLSKAEAARWACERLDDPTAVTLALARRNDPTLPPLTPSQVGPVVRRAELAIDLARSDYSGAVT